MSNSVNENSFPQDEETQEEGVPFFKDEFLLNSLTYLQETILNFYKVVNFYKLSSGRLRFKVWIKWSEFVAVDDYEEYNDEIEVTVTQKEITKWLEKQSK